MTALVDQTARDRIRDDLDQTFVVEAAAGTGKTRALVGRIVQLISRDHAKLSQLVAVTFTDRAGGEMKLRLRAALEAARAATPTGQRTLFDDALEELETARIGTIHAFCAELLREHPILAGVDPMFEVAAGDEEERIYSEAFEAWFAELLEEPPAGVSRLLRRRPRSPRDPGPRDLLHAAGRARAGRRDFDGPWRHQPFDRASEVDDLFEKMEIIEGYAARRDRIDDWLAKSVAAIARFRRDVRHRERGMRHGIRDYDGIEADLRAFSRERHWRWKGRNVPLFAEGLERTEVLRRRDELKVALDAFVRGADADLAYLLNSELAPLVERYERIKKREGRLDFLDLLVITRNLIRDDDAVRARLQQRFTHILIDEFQDTDPLQAEILLLLSADDPRETNWRAVTPVRGKLFVVGDPKQSIYRFRRTDIALYEAIKQQLIDREADLLYLTTSFRALGDIQEAVNSAFAQVMPGSGPSSQIRYVALEPHRTDVPVHPSVVALPVPRPYGYRDVASYAIERSYPDVVGAFVEYLIATSGWTVSGRDGGAPVPVAARHICLLFRRFQSFGRDLTAPYRSALEARDVPHVLVGGRSFFEREEVLAVQNAVTAIEWPGDELALYATLRGPFFALGDDLLFAWRHHLGRLHPFSRPEAIPDELQPVAEGLTVLRELHRRRNQRPTADTIGELLTETRAHAGVAIWPSGEQALANLARMLDRARRFDASGGLSFRAFVERMSHERERGATAEAPAVEEGTEGVRVMTVHQAKGLEFPVVILCDPTAPLCPTRPSRWMDHTSRTWAESVAGCAPVELLDHERECIRHDTEETVRVAYVAATRARDLLVIPTIGDDDGDMGSGSWTDVLAPALYPARDNRRRPADAPGCPVFSGKDTVLERPNEALHLSRHAVLPGLHRPMVGNHPVVWWDPASLTIDAPLRGGLRNQDLLVPSPDNPHALRAAEQHQAWVRQRADRIGRGSQPQLVTYPLTSPEARARLRDVVADVDAKIDTTDIDRTRRPSGRRFGTLVHSSLASATTADAVALERIVEACARKLGATSEEVHAAVTTIEIALGHSLLQRAVRAEEMRWEAPVALPLPDGVVVEGAVDLAFREDGHWTVVELKTDADLSAHRTRYLDQARAYAAAVAAAVDAPVDAFVLWV